MKIYHVKLFFYSSDQENFPLNLDRLKRLQTMFKNPTQVIEKRKIYHPDELKSLSLTDAALHLNISTSTDTFRFRIGNSNWNHAKELNIK